MPPQQLTPDDERVFEEMFGSGATPPEGLTAEDERVFNEMFSDKPVDLDHQVPAALASAADVTQAVANVQPVSPNLSLIDDFRPKIAAAAKGMLRAAKTQKGLVRVLGAAASQVKSDLLTSDDVLAHAAGAGLGDVWSVAKDPRAKEDWYRTGIKRATKFMQAAGYDKIATAEEAAEITSAYLFGELALRTPLQPESLGRANRHSIKSLVAERRQLVAEQAQGGLVSTDPAFFNAAAYLDDMSEEEATALRGFMQRTTARPARNEQEALLAKRNDDIWGGEETDWSNMRRATRSANRALSAMKVLLGVDSPEENVLNRMESDEHVWRLRDLGFLSGDLSRPGVRIANPSGGFVDSMLVPNETLARLENRKREMGIATPFDAGPDDVKGLADATGMDPEEAKKLSDTVAAVMTAGAAGGAALPEARGPEAEALTPGEASALSPFQKTLIRAYGVFGDAFSLARKPVDAWREAQKGRLGGMIGQMGVQLITGREDLAREADDVFDMIGTGVALIGQYNNMQAFGEGKAQELLGTEKATILNEIPIMREIDSRHASEVLKGFTASNVWTDAKGREDARREEEKRQGRMSALERGFPEAGYGRLQYAVDIMRSGLHNVWEGLGQVTAQVIDDPQLLPLIMGAEKLSDEMVAAPINSFRNAIKAGLNAQASKQAMRQILQHAPHEVARLRRIATERLAKAGTQSEAVGVLRDLAAASKDLESQWAGVRRGGKGPARDTIERVATLWRNASDYGVDFDALDSMVERMIPHGFEGLVSAARGASGKAPIHMTRAGLEGLSRSYREMANRVLPSLGRKAMDLRDAVDLERAASVGDQEAVQELVRRQAGYSHDPGIAEKLEMNAEVESLYEDLRAGRRVDPQRFDYLRTKLWGAPDMDPLDWGTLQQLSDVGRWKPGSKVGNLVARMFGYAPDQLLKLQTSIKTVLDFAAKDAKDFYLAKVNNEAINLRRLRAYDYAKAKVRVAQMEAELDGDARTHKALDGLHHQLVIEQRRASSNPVGQPYRLTDDLILRQTLTDGDLAYVVENNPELFRGAHPSDFPDDQIRGLFETEGLKADLQRYRVLEKTDAINEIQEEIKAGRAEIAAEKKAALTSEIRASVDESLQNIPEFESIARADNALKLMSFDLDSFGAAGMPFWAMSRHFREVARDVGYRQSLDYERFADLHQKLEDVRRTMSPEETAKLDELMKRPYEGDADLARAYPDLALALEQAHPDGLATKARNVKQLLEGSEAMRRRLINDLWDLGMIDDQFKAELIKKGYDPHVYELNEVPHAIRRNRGRNSKGQNLVEGPELDPLKFQKSLTDYRVRVREADGFIRDERFPSEAKAKAWIRRTYGAKAAETMKTPSKEDITLAAPLDAETRHVLGLVDGMTPESQLLKLQRLSRDIHLSLFLRSLRSSGLVVSPREFNRLFLESGARQVELQDQFTNLPNDRRAFGDLAGWKVHKKVFSELVKASHSFEQFRTWMDGIERVYRMSGGSVPEELADRAPTALGRAYRGLNRAAKTALILNNLPVWMSNVLFNVGLTHLVDGKIFAAENRGELSLAWRETFGSRRGALRSPEWQEFVRQGFGVSGAFDVDLPPEKIRNEMRMLGLDKPQVIASRVAKYNQVLARYQDALQRGEKPALLAKVQEQLVSLRAALDEHDKGFLRKASDKIAGYFLLDRDLFNRPRNQTAARLKQLYGAVDDFFKFANYLSLRKRMGPLKAAWEIREHFQDYSRLPYTIHSLSNNPLGSLVPSFGYELMRISRNLMKNHPVRFMAFMHTLPALNIAGELAAGMTSDRVQTFLGQAGHRNNWERYKSYFTELRTWDPVNHTPLFSVSMASMLPFANIFEGRGFLQQAAENWFPEEERGFGGGVLATGLEALGLFAGNNPLLNAGGVLAFNRDAVTGQEVLDRETARPIDYLKAFGRHAVRNFIPRTPSVLFADLPDSLAAPFDPTTGRSVGTTSPAELLSAHMGFRIRGIDSLLRSRGASEGHPLGRDEAMVKSVIYSVLGRKTGPGMAQFGREAEIRELMARRDEPGLEPERKAAYDKALQDLLKEERTVSIPGQDVTISTTEREELLRLAALEKRGVATALSRATPEETAAIMIWLDRAGLSDTNLGNLTQTITRTPLNRPRFEDDPESMDRAIKMLDQHLREKTSSRRLEEIREWWSRTRNKASGLERRRRLREAARAR